MGEYMEMRTFQCDVFMLTGAYEDLHVLHIISIEEDYRQVRLDDR